MLTVVIVGIAAGVMLTSKKEVVKVTGMQEADAKSSLEGLGFEVGISYDTSYDIEKGVVISQSVAEGTKLSKGRKVDIVVCNDKLVKLPDVVGLSSDDAKKKLEDAGLKVSIETEYSDMVESGKVISQSPEAKDGDGISAGETVSILVSEGAQGVEMPDLTGANIDGAKDKLDGLGLLYEVEEEYSDIYAKYMVISQDVTAGSKVDPGTTVKLVVSLGEEVKTTEATQAATRAKSTTQAQTATQATTQATTQAPVVTEAPTAAPVQQDDISGFDE